MAYRDEVETRRAHVRRLEATLEDLATEEALVRSLPQGERSWVSRVLGGPRVLEHSFVVEGPVRDVAALASETFGVDGKLDVDGDTSIWDAEPEPLPRRVLVRAVEREDGTTLVDVHDRSNYRALVGLFAAAPAPMLLVQPDTLRLFIGCCIIALAIGLVFVLRRADGRRTRRRARQALAFEDVVTKRSRAARVRVGADEGEEEVLADVAKRAGAEA